MRYRLVGFGRRLGWPVLRFGDHVSLDDAVRAANQVLAEHPECERVEIYGGESLLHVVRRTATD